MTDAAAKPTVNSAIPTPVSIISKDWAWLRTHIILLVFVVGLAFGGVYFVENLISKHDAANSAKYEQILAAQTLNTQTLQKQLSTDEANWAQVEAQLLAQNAQLTKEVSQRNQAVTVQVQKDATLSASDSALRIALQTHAGAGEVTAQGDNIILDLHITRAVVSDLDQLPVVQANLADTQKQLANETEIAVATANQNAEEQKLIVAEEAQLADQKKSYDAQITTLKANARRGKLKWFGIGYIAGFVSGVTAHLW